MDWLKANWLAALLAVLAAATWIVHQEIDAQSGRNHRQAQCYERCIAECRAWCEQRGITFEECGCPRSCEERCG